MKLFRYMSGALSASILVVSMLNAASPPDEQFELWNKTDHKIWYTLENGNKKVKKGLLSLEPNTKQTYSIDIKQPSKLYIDYNRGNQNKFTSWTKGFDFPAGKTIYVRLKQEKGKYIFGPQTGPWLGWKGKTDSGYSLSNNVKDRDIIEYEVQQLSHEVKALLALPSIIRAIGSNPPKITEYRIIQSPDTVAPYIILEVAENANEKQISEAAKKLVKEIRNMPGTGLAADSMKALMGGIIVDASGKMQQKRKQ